MNGRYVDLAVKETADLRKIAAILEKRKRRSHSIGLELQKYLQEQKNNNKGDDE